MTIGSRIDLSAYQSGGDDDSHYYSTIFVNNKSFDSTPFNTLRITGGASFYVGSSFIFYKCTVKILNTAKQTLTTLTATDESGTLDDTLTFDISTIDQQAFFAIGFESVTSCSGGTAWVSKIEFLN